MIGPKTPRLTRAQERAAYEAVTARDGGRCVRCGWYGTVHRDHRKNRSVGGLTTPAGLQLLCGPHGEDPGCHAWKHANPSAAVLEGFAVPGWARVETWPAWRWDVGGYVIYFDEPDEEGRWWRPITQSVADLLMNGGRP